MKIELRTLFIGASVSEPHTCQTAPPAIYVSLYMYRMSFRKQMPPCSNSLDSFDFVIHHQARLTMSYILLVYWCLIVSYNSLP